MPDRLKQQFSLALKFKIWAMPCAVCGIPFDIHCDHIIPRAKGGSGEQDNIQPLCRWCNQIKKHRLDNKQVAQRVIKRAEMHFLMAVYGNDTRYFGFAEGPTFAQWLEHCPERVRYGMALYESFISRHK